MGSLGFKLQNEAVLNIITLVLLKSSEIEGAFLENKLVVAEVRTVI